MSRSTSNLHEWRLQKWHTSATLDPSSPLSAFGLALSPFAHIHIRGRTATTNSSFLLLWLAKLKSIFYLCLGLLEIWWAFSLPETITTMFWVKAGNGYNSVRFFWVQSLLRPTVLALVVGLQIFLHIWWRSCKRARTQYRGFFKNLEWIGLLA